MGCAQTVLFKTEKRGATLEVDGQNVGEIPAEGKQVEIRSGFAALPIKVTLSDGTTHESEVPRTEGNNWLFAAGLVGAGLCVPALCAAGLWVANPLAPLACLAACGGGGCGAGYAFLAQTATFWSAPIGALGACVGLSPLIATGLSGELPDVVTLQVPQAPEVAAKGGMAF
jgi:hypothetical protein